MNRHLPLILAAAALLLTGCASTAAPETVTDDRQRADAGAAARAQAQVLQQQQLNDKAIAGCVAEVIAVVDVTRAQAQAGCEMRLLDGYAPMVVPAPEPTRISDEAAGCYLRRIGVQYVKCDDLTGAGAPAPDWVPEQQARPQGRLRVVP